MKHILFEKRNGLYYQFWQENKNTLTMEDCSDIFNCELKTYYRILKKEQIKEYERGINPNVKRS